MKRPNRKDYIQKASIIQLLADLEMYIDYLEAQNQALTIPVVVGQSEQLFCSCGNRKLKTTGGSQCTNNRCSL